MRIPVISGVIGRRILLNYRIDPEVVTPLLPKCFKPKLVNNFAIAGICLIRLEQIRPKGLPASVGVTSENSAHRFAVTWQDESGCECEGVYIPRRDTNSVLNSLAGGRLFPGVHHFSTFTVQESDDEISMRVENQTEKPLVELLGVPTDRFREDSVFDSLQQSSDFFAAGHTGYSSRPDSDDLDGLVLKTPEWQVSPLKIDQSYSSYFDDESIFPKWSIEFDHALLMRGVAHEWHAAPTMKL